MGLQQLVAQAADPDDGRHGFEPPDVDKPAQFVGQMRAVAIAHDDVADDQVEELSAQRADGFGAASHAGAPAISQR
ncbi:hypothetical protein G6F40_016311 [Rhizopus arrhizus]|nr:hypothetical protein G6F40_016311 [Rhizopus arrhizus]